MLGQPFEQLTLEKQRDLRFTVGFGYQEFFVHFAAALVERTREPCIGNEKIIDAVRDLERVELVQQRL